MIDLTLKVGDVFKVSPGAFFVELDAFAGGKFDGVLTVVWSDEDMTCFKFHDARCRHAERTPEAREEIRSGRWIRRQPEASAAQPGRSTIAANASPNLADWTTGDKQTITLTGNVTGTLTPWKCASLYCKTPTAGPVDPAALSRMTAGLRRDARDKCTVCADKHIAHWQTQDDGERERSEVTPPPTQYPHAPTSMMGGSVRTPLGLWGTWRSR